MASFHTTMTTIAVAIDVALDGAPHEANADDVAEFVLDSLADDDEITDPAIRSFVIEHAEELRPTIRAMAAAALSLPWGNG